MHDLHKALADIGNIRQQLAAGTMFRGFGPAVIATTGLLALASAAVQAAWFDDLGREPLIFLGVWVMTAIVSAGLIGVEMLARSGRHHSGLADAMIVNAIGYFLPAGAAGAAIAQVIVRFAPDNTWMLPGLWQVLVSIGIFASVRSLPRTVGIAGAWYFVAGIAVLMLSSQTQALSPWAMGIPLRRWPASAGRHPLCRVWRR